LDTILQNIGQDNLWWKSVGVHVKENHFKLISVWVWKCTWIEKRYEEL